MRNISKIIVIISISISLQSCFVSKSSDIKNMRSEFSVENNAIPPNFGKNKSEVLLVLITGFAVDKFHKKALKEKYFGEYELHNPKTDLDEKFPDKSKYRYVFVTGGGTSYGQGNLGGQYKRYFVYDRLDKKEYSSGAEFSNFALALKIYMENLNTQRLKNLN